MLKKDLKERIEFLEGMIRKYYRANYEIKKMAGIPVGVYCCGNNLQGNEEYMTQRDVEGLKNMINNLPLWDCGC